MSCLHLRCFHWKKANFFGLKTIAHLRSRPKTVKLNNALSALEVFEHLHASFDSCFLFESKESDKELARYSFLGFNPAAKIVVDKGRMRVEEEGKTREFKCENPFELIEPFTELSSKKTIGFLGGLVGYVSYDAVQYFCPVKLTSRNKTGFFDAEFGVFLDGIVFDRLKKTVSYVTLKEDRATQLQNLPEKTNKESPLRLKQKGFDKSPKSFEKAVCQTRKYVCSGETFQSVISRRQNLEINGDKLAIYRTLRKVNPSPYMYCLKFKQREIIGSSPEMLVRVENNVAITFPIAGTRPRGKNANEDARLARELLKDEKEKAEHLMLVDLARNDIGKVSKFGSVKVEQFMKVKKFSHVQHLVSMVSGKMKKGLSCIDAFESVFPAGTVSGAPKLRSMQIIDKLENEGRGPYAGAVGYFSLNGNCDFAIAIRTLFANGSRAFVQAGAGIVYDSKAEKEFIETQDKAQAVLSAIKKAKDAIK